MAELTLALVISILTNLLLFRWAVNERTNRRQWQQEAIALQHALRRKESPNALPGAGWGLWLAAGLLVAIGFLAILQLG